MKTKILKGSIIGGIVAFSWSVISWMALPWHEMAFNQFSDEQAVSQVIKEQTPRAGMYVLPWVDHTNEEEAKAGQERMKEGPFGLLVLHPDGMEPEMGLNMLLGFLVNLLAGGIFTYLYLLAKPTGSLYRKALFFTWISVVSGVLCCLPNMVWWGYPLLFTAVSMMDLVIPWSIAGVLIAKWIKH